MCGMRKVLQVLYMEYAGLPTWSSLPRTTGQQDFELTAESLIPKTVYNGIRRIFNERYHQKEVSNIQMIGGFNAGSVQNKLEGKGQNE